MKKIYEPQAWLQEFGWFRNQPRPTMTWSLIKDALVLQSLREEIIHKLRIVAALFGFRLMPLLGSISILGRPEVSQNVRPIISVSAKPEVRMR